MNKRHFLKTGAAVAAGALLPKSVLSSPSSGLYGFQKKALEQIAKYKRNMFIWPRASGKTHMFHHLCDLSKVPERMRQFVYSVSDEEARTVVIDYNLGKIPTLMGIDANKFARDCDEMYDRDYDMNIFITPNEANSPWILDNFERFNVNWLRDSDCAPLLDPTKGRQWYMKGQNIIQTVRDGWVGKVSLFRIGERDFWPEGEGISDKSYNGIVGVYGVWTSDLEPRTSNLYPRKGH
jgi:hypothetical protein